MNMPSGLCVGLDPDPNKFPNEFDRSTAGVIAFLGRIVEATRSHAAAYKINVAFFEQMGLDGMRALYAVREVVGESYLVVDAKRGDIGNTSKAYAQAVFSDLAADATTVHPYMGYDSVAPFLEYANKCVFVLALTSNSGSKDFQRLPIDGKPLYKHVMQAAATWPTQGITGFVVGATHASELAEVRSQFPTSAFLIPGIGAQGGDAAEIAGANNFGPALFSASRSILYASAKSDFAEAAAREAEAIATTLSPYITSH